MCRITSVNTVYLSTNSSDLMRVLEILEEMAEKVYTFHCHFCHSDRNGRSP